MRPSRVRTLKLVIAAAMAASCHETLGPPDITPEQAAFAAAVVSAGALSGRAGGYATLALAQADTRGQIGTFDAIGVQLLYDLPDPINGSGRDIGWFVGVVGATGVDLASRTAAEVMSAGGQGSGNGAFSTGSVDIGQFVNDREGVAIYARKTPQALYVGVSGTFTVTSASFTTPRPCGVEGGGASTVSCTFAIGTMTGTLNFSANLTQGTGTSPYDFPQTTFSIPAIQVSMTQQ